MLKEEMKQNEQSKIDIKIGDTVTASTTNSDGDTIFVSGEISSVNGDNVFLMKRFPKIEHHSVKVVNIIKKGE